ncbi:MarR family winged helix-turn-helix transcriptional regulator [Streptomyces yaanensis]|uniref:MarR family winged helix-turn-helix transcriptional regulator n=1 Tax=Streptomyces yaanensis TaxID=1142239 RepID=A0ABV7SLA3_9ACTN|nr:MarR family transcriptional regulator [Streptomyces sp. CGMCC 4.7035]WNC00380.1 MarR family transcriptional regulator [Streptomyces sp. CGMCC 4.7035]
MADALSRESSVGYQVNHMARLFAQALAVRIAPYGVVRGQFAQLLALFEQDGLSQRELCDRVRVEQPTMANTLQRMERDGLVRRVPDPSDRRRTRVHLTEHAREIEQKLLSAALAVNGAATAGLTDAEIATYLDLTARVIHNLEAGAGQ